MRLRNLFEAESTTIGLVFGRFNPPHIGHKAAWEMASKCTYWYIGTNKNTKGPKDPLPFDVKVEAMSTVWPPVGDHIMAEQSWLTLASHCFGAHKDATELVCFTDEDWVTKTIQQYNGKEGPHGFYNFKTIRQEATPRLSSATALRDAVVKGDRAAFTKAAGVDANTQIAGKPYFDLVAEYLLPYTNAPKKDTKKNAAEAVEQIDEISKSAEWYITNMGKSSKNPQVSFLPGAKATHTLNKIILHPVHGAVLKGTELRHLGGNDYEVRAGQAKGKSISVMGHHVQKIDEAAESVAESGPFSYGGKPPRKGSVADLAARKRREQEQGKTPIEPKDQQVGVAKVMADVTTGHRVDEGAIETITALAKKIPGIGKYYQMAQQYKPELVQILKTSKTGAEVKQKIEHLAANPAPVAESGMGKQIGGLAVGGGSILSAMWMNAMGMIDGVLAHAAAGEVGGAVAAGSILGLIPVTLMLLATMLLFKGGSQSSDEKAKSVQAMHRLHSVSESAASFNQDDFFEYDPKTMTVVKDYGSKSVQASTFRKQLRFSDEIKLPNGNKIVNGMMAARLKLNRSTGVEEASVAGEIALDPKLNVDGTPVYHYMLGPKGGVVANADGYKVDNERVGPGKTWVKANANGKLYKFATYQLSLEPLKHEESVSRNKSHTVNENPSISTNSKQYHLSDSVSIQEGILSTDVAHALKNYGKSVGNDQMITAGKLFSMARYDQAMRLISQLSPEDRKHAVNIIGQAGGIMGKRITGTQG